MSWASFSIVEVMSQSRFAHKRIGYLAANQVLANYFDLDFRNLKLFRLDL
jgi:AP-3 complex subunit delta-1